MLYYIQIGIYFIIHCTYIYTVYTYTIMYYCVLSSKIAYDIVMYIILHTHTYTHVYVINCLYTHILMILFLWGTTNY